MEKVPTKNELTLYQYDHQGLKIVSINHLTDWYCKVLCEMPLDRFIEILSKEPKLNIGRGDVTEEDFNKLLEPFKSINSPS